MGRAVASALRRAGNPGRSGHVLSIRSARDLFDARERLAALFDARDSSRFVFTENATAALNQAIKGLLRPGDHVVTTSVEHNSVMRPLRALEKDGVQLEVVCCRPDGTIDLDLLRSAIVPGTRLVLMTHASNIVGTIMPVAEAARMAHEAGALLLVDAAQTAGVFPIDVLASGIDFLAFTGHKGLQGPTGTGGLVLGERVNIDELKPLVRGGTGSKSEFEQQPDMLPDKYESGTPNGVGIAGLAAGVRWVRSHGIESIREHEAYLSRALIGGLMNNPAIQVYGSTDDSPKTAVVSCRIKGRRVSEIGLALDEDYGILCRVGLHCAPSAHRTIGTFPEGTIRLAPGFSTSIEDIQEVIRALEKLAAASG